MSANKFTDAFKRDAVALVAQGPRRCTTAMRLVHRAFGHGLGVIDAFGPWRTVKLTAV